MDADTCGMCKEGFFLDTSDSANVQCVEMDSCTDSTFADKTTGTCAACSENCANCGMKANSCTSCDASKKFFGEIHKCFDNCPIGTYVNAEFCAKCPNNLLNCDVTTGTAPTSMMAMTCSERCDGCFWTPNHCVGCADGFKKADHGRCVPECPESTYEMEMGGKAICAECSQGCSKCITEADDCSEDTNPSTGPPSNTTGQQGNNTGGNPPSPIVARCVRCDKDLGFYLFRDKCVRMCPHGTYADKLTGWCAKCDCNCGDGGCINAHTCKTCNQPGMYLNKDSGMCACDTDFTAAWNDGWKSFTITIDSPDVKFRDLETEAMNGFDLSNKMCFIGNEAQMMMMGNGTESMMGKITKN